MKIAAIIAEYNPFHSGHLHQIQQIRDTFGSDTAIIAIMSGNYTQRGELALTDKVTRAECAVRCGVNLVLELPFPYSLSSAEYFAKAGVCIADSIGCVDVLSFGSESGNIDSLTLFSKALASAELSSLRDQLLTDDPSLGHAAATERAYRALCPESEISFSPNNILACEYIKAACKTRLALHTVMRVGADYHDTELSSDFASASAIRRAIIEGNPKAYDAVPKPVSDILKDKKASGALPSDPERLFSAVISKFLLNTSDAPCEIHDAKDGLYNRLKAKANEATSLLSMTALSETKKYTRARIWRTLWYTLLGVTSSLVCAPVRYTQLLAADTVGLAILKRIKGVTSIPILTKPSDINVLSKDALCAKQCADDADRMYMLSLPVCKGARTALTFTPFILS